MEALNMSQFSDGTTAVVTGAARGIGLGVAKKLTSSGCRVAAWDIDLEPLARDPISKDIHRVRVNVADLSSVRAAVRNTINELGHIDILVNNAGVNGPTVPAWEYLVEEWDRVMAVDLRGVFLCCREVIPHMRNNKNGRIINVASVAGKEGNPIAVAYSAAKAGVIGMTKSLAKELVDDGIYVNCVAPAMTETDFLQGMTEDYISIVKSQIPMGRLCTVSEIADMIAWIAGPQCTFTTGAVFDLSGGRATY
jgi:NAD(P)-dependent dehydrogenase (short-subunit alcohol dehydrogenase family)